MQIIQVTPYYAPAYAFGGVVRAVEGLSRALVARGHSVTVITTDAHTREQPLAAPHEEWRDGVRVLRYRNAVYPLRRLNLSTPLGMGSGLRQHMPLADVIHLHEFRTVETWLAARNAAHFPAPLVLSPHGTLTRATGRSTVKAFWDRLLSPGVAAKIAHVVPLTAKERDDVLALWRELLGTAPPMTVIPNGVNADEFAALPDASMFRERYNLGSARVVLFLGRLHPRKGVEVLARAFQQAKLPGVKLVFAGADEGALQTIQPLLSEDVRYIGFLDAAARLEALAAADLFALPARGEGLSLASLEALAAGVPVLLSPECYLPDVESAGVGRIVAPEVEPLAAALHDLLSDPAALATMRPHTRPYIAATYTWERVAAAMEAVYAAHPPFRPPTA